VRHPQRKFQRHKRRQITSALTTAVVSSEFVMGQEQESPRYVTNLAMAARRKGRPPARTLRFLKGAGFDVLELDLGSTSGVHEFFLRADKICSCSITALESGLQAHRSKPAPFANPAKSAAPAKEGSKARTTANHFSVNYPVVSSAIVIGQEK